MASPARRLNTTPEKSPQADIHRARLLLADMQRDRRAANDTEPADNDNAVPSGGATDKPVLLELPTRSYARPVPTEAEKEATRQAEMRHTAERLFPGQRPTGEEIQTGRPPRAEPSPTEAQESEPAGEAGRQERETPDTAAMAERERMAEMDRLRMEDARQRSKDRDSRSDRKRRASLKRKRRAKANKNGRRILKIIQLAAAETVFPLFTLIAQMNLETINKWITKKRIPGIIEPEPNPRIDSDDVATGMVDCCGCFLVLLLFLLGFLLLLGAWFVFNPLDVAQVGIDLSL